jgi:hypothetical protein
MNGIDVTIQLWRLPIPGISNVEVIGVLGQARSGQLNEASAVIQSERSEFDAPLARPCH